MDQQIQMGRFLKKSIVKNLIPALIAAVLYWKTLLPDVGFWDTGEFQTVGKTFDIPHPTGFPIYLILLKTTNFLLPFGEAAFKANLLSLVFTSLAILFLSLAIDNIIKNKIIAIISPLLVSISYPVWFVGNRADPHSLNFVLISLFLYLTTKNLKKEKTKNYYLSGLVLGLALANHPISVFFIPTFVLSVTMAKIKNQEKIKTLLLTTIPLGFYLIIPALYKAKGAFTIDYPLNNFQGLKRYILGEDFKAATSFHYTKLSIERVIISIKMICDYIYLPYVITSFLGILIGITNKKTAKIILCLLPSLVINFVFNTSYANAVIERYYIQILAILTIFASVAIDKIINYKNKIKTAMVILFAIINLILINKTISKNFPILDQSKNLEAKIWTEKALNQTEENSVIFSWWSYSTPLWYYQKVKNQRKDITIINTNPSSWEKMAKEIVNQRPVYFIENISLNREEFLLEKRGVLYKFERRANY